MSPHPLPGPDPAEHRTHRIDLLWIGGATLATYAIASRLELFERFGSSVSRFERFQLDELLFTLISLAAGLAWYARRRQREAVAALRRSRECELHIGELLAHNRVLSQQVLTAQERERLELARELHDDIGQCCNAVSVEAAVIAQSGASEMQSIQAGARRIGALASDLYDRVHALLRKLRPADLDTLGLAAALQALCASWQTRSGVACALHPDGDCDTLNPACQIAVYRVAQEALSNAMRHARASVVGVALRRGADGGLTLEVRDDGVGFDAHSVHGGFGLLGATERAAALGGALDVHSRAGAGTVLTLSLPAAAVGA